MEIQAGLLDRVFHFGKPFFDANRNGYLLKRLEGDVHRMGWFFSGSMAVMVENLFRFLGGAIFLLYLDWRLAMSVGIVLPGGCADGEIFFWQASHAEQRNHGNTG